jgi:DNA-binding Lrp family transcriptional regulator
MTERLKIIGEIILQEQGLFSVKKVARETGLSVGDVQTVLDRLFREGVLLRFKRDPEFASLRGRPKSKMIYERSSRKVLLQKIGPRLKEDTAQDRMWSVIRNKSRFEGFFTVRNLVLLAEVKRENARWFVKMLRRAGIIRPSKPGGPGVEWILVKDVGPRRPYVGAVTRRRQDAETRR